MHLYMIRHGQKTIGSRPNEKPDWQLTELGRRQAEHVAEAFRDINIDTLISSPLLRALQTAAPLALMKGMKIHVWRDLVESYNGERYIGPAPAKLRKSYPIGIFDPEEPDGWTYAGGETEEDVVHRADKTVRRLCKESYSHQTVVMIAHRGFNQKFFNRLFGSSFAVFEQLNGCINHIELREEAAMVNRINDTRHIPAGELTEN